MPDESTHSRSRNILPETTRQCNKCFSTHYKSVRNSEFFKSTNTNSQTLCNSEELLAEKAVSANSHPSPEKTEWLECWIGILFQCEDLQLRFFEFLQIIFICFTSSTDTVLAPATWRPVSPDRRFTAPKAGVLTVGPTTAHTRHCFPVSWDLSISHSAWVHRSAGLGRKGYLDEGKKACVCISQKVYLEPKWLRYSSWVKGFHVMTLEHNWPKKISRSRHKLSRSRHSKDWQKTHQVQT